MCFIYGQVFGAFQETAHGASEIPWIPARASLDRNDGQAAEASLISLELQLFSWIIFSILYPPLRSLRLRLLPLIVPMLFAFHLNAQEQPAPKDTLWLVPHTHWEGAVFKTREEYLEIGLGDFSFRLAAFLQVRDGWSPITSLPNSFLRLSSGHPALIQEHICQAPCVVGKLDVSL
jgi:hypothetical protein